MIEVLGIKEQISEGFDAVRPQMNQTAVALNLDEAESQKLFMVYKAWFKNDIDHGQIEEEIVALYVDAFTVEEMQEIAKFYQSSTGQKFVELRPELQDEGARVTMLETQKKQSLLINRLESFLTKRAENSESSK